MIVKICGLSTPEAVRTARDGGATHLGFIFFPKSPRYVTVEQAALLVRDKGKTLSVAVSVNADDDFLDHIVSTMSPDLLQFHGSETPERVTAIKARYGLPVMKAVAVRNSDDLARAKSYEYTADMILLDAKPPEGSELPGGNGVSFDWSLLQNFETTKPVLLSGGLDIANLPEAINRVLEPENAITGLDVSSGVESAPGVKDLARIEAFLTTCRQSAN